MNESNPSLPADRSIDPALHIESIPIDGATAALSDPHAEIQSVNATAGRSTNRTAKTLFVLLTVVILVGAAVAFGRNWMTSMKQAIKPATGKASPQEASDLFNPEATKRVTAPVKLGADGSKPPAPGPAAPIAAATSADCDGPGTRALRGPDNRLMLNAQGRALCVDTGGKVTEVPAIKWIGSDGRKPLPNAGTAAPPPTTAGAGAAQKPPSRYGGALLADGGGANPPAPSSTAVDAGAASSSGAAKGSPSSLDLMRTLAAMQQARSGQAAPAGTTAVAMPVVSRQPEGSVGSQLVSSATPVALAARFGDQNLMLPKGRQADCVLTTRILNEVPGFTSCVLSENLYGDNGRVLLLERGSEVSGEYGVGNQLGLRRLFVVWNRVKTPDGVVVDLQSPGADPLGTSGVPGFLEQRWLERIGGALLISIMKDAFVAVAARESSTSSGGVVVQQPPLQNTSQAGQSIAEQVLKETLKVRPTLSINEGERVSIYVARDLDFSAVYVLRHAGVQGTVSGR